jgi:putative heme-binding domain-containing protein
MAERAPSLSPRDRAGRELERGVAPLASPRSQIGERISSRPTSPRPSPHCMAEREPESVARRFAPAGAVAARCLDDEKVPHPLLITPNGRVAHGKFPSLRVAVSLSLLVVIKSQPPNRMIHAFAPRILTLASLWLSLLAVSFCPLASAQPKPTLELRDGDRVVLIGDTLIEREQLYGYLEHRLTVRFPAKNILFRNLGWSADTAAGESRASFDFDKPGTGFERLQQQVTAIQPTVILIGYGMASSFDGEAGLGEFKTKMNHLLDTLQTVCTNQPLRIVLLTPVRHENLGAPLPDPAAHNRQLALYTKAIYELAVERAAANNSGALRKYFYVSLYNNLLGDGTQVRPPRPFTDDGIHLTAYGYLRMAEAIEKGFVWEPNLWRVEITADGKVTDGSYGTKVSDLERTGNHIRFTSEDEQLVTPTLRDKHGRIPTADSPSLVQIDGLKSGRYQLTVDGTPVVTATAKEWQNGVIIERGPQFEQAELLRQTILKKNELFFDRWRPQNETYLLGFRKHEQGQNAKEIPMFDPLIAEQEAKIARLRRPVAHTYELLPAGKSSARKPAAEDGQPLNSSALPVPAKPGSLPQFEIAPGFEISLYAESPLLAKPIQMNFDPRGRLWVASSSVYPQIEPGQQANDKIILLEDTKGVGKVDKSTIFADGLLIPTGVEPGDGGVYVGQSTELLHFKDTDGDGRADQKRVVLSGFGTEDTHHIVHTLHWGHDGQLYFDQSIYIHSHIETPNGVVRLNSGGIWSLRPSTMELAVYLRGFCNPWGHQFDEFGQSFVTDGAGYQGISFGVPGATYFSYAGMRRELKSISPGRYPKFCGLELIQSRQFPDDWQGNAITCDFRAHRVVRFAFDEKDSGYASREMPDLLRTTNITFRPIDVKLGPDGALYIADWSNPIIQHGEVDFRDPRRDHEHGRIWRVTAKGRPLVKRPELINASNRALFNELLSPNKYNQQQARRVLTERGTGIAPDLAKWTKAQKAETALLEALWMYQSIDLVEPVLLGKLLSAQDGHIRAAATRVVSAWHSRLSNPQDLLSQRIADAHPRVRLEAMRALAQIPTARSAELVLSALDKPMDPFLDYGVWLSINDLAQPWLDAIKSGAWKPEGREEQLEFGLKAIEPALASTVLSQVLQGKSIPRDGSGPWIELVGQAGDAEQLRRLFDQVLSGGFDNPASVRALSALSESARLRKVKPPGDLDRVGSLFTSSSEKIRRSALELAGHWNLESLTARLVTIAGEQDSKPDLREAAFASLREIGGTNVIAALQPLTEKTNAVSIRQQAVVALAALDIQQARQPAIELLGDLKSETEALELWRSILSIKGAAAALTQALPKSGLPPVMAKTGMRVAREGGRSEPDLIFALSRGADLEGEGQTLSDAEIKDLVASVLKQGSAARGEKVFRRKDSACTSCHSIGGAGGKVGPDLTSIGTSAQVDYLIESVLYPNRKIKEGYHSILVETADGEELSGVLVRENTEQLVLRAASDKEISIAKNNIKSRTLGNSLMPSGLVDPLTAGERLDLYRFLSELGKPGPYDASKGSVARFWKLYPQNLDLTQFGDEKILNSPLTDTAWAAVLTLVDGRLPKVELKESLHSVQARIPQAVFAAAQLQVAKAGPVRLQWTGATDSPLWIDGKPIDRNSSLDLPAGAHTIIVKLDAQKLPDSLRLESPDGTFLTN